MLSTTRAANSYEWSAARSWMSQSCSNDRYGLQCSKCTHLIEAGSLDVVSHLCDVTAAMYSSYTRPDRLSPRACRCFCTGLGSACLATGCQASPSIAFGHFLLLARFRAQTRISWYLWGSHCGRAFLGSGRQGSNPASSGWQALHHQLSS